MMMEGVGFGSDTVFWKEQEPKATCSYLTNGQLNEFIFIKKKKKKLKNKFLLTDKKSKIFPF